jgi:hypothetical protein
MSSSQSYNAFAREVIGSPTPNLKEATAVTVLLSEGLARG